jgi:hypothetical protein
MEKNVNDMGKKDIEENIWTNKGEWAVENWNKRIIDDLIQSPRCFERNRDSKIGMAWTRGWNE